MVEKRLDKDGKRDEFLKMDGVGFTQQQNKSHYTLPPEAVKAGGEKLLTMFMLRLDHFSPTPVVLVEHKIFVVGSTGQVQHSAGELNW